ncbi:MAG: D-glycero-beta-D-manno-heptose 1-phosphate adenylyltransferase [Hyphomonadaceae bacterium]
MTPTQDDIRRLAKGRVLVIGDAMVDHYVSGRVSRVSDEAPVPIVHVSDERWTAGGAGNVAANIAAGIVVAKRGTATASPAELIAEIEAGKRVLGGSPGAISLAAAKALRETWGREGLSVGFTNGCFDILHAGHVALLRDAAKTCDRLIVALNTDASVSKLKGPSRPVQSEAVRAAVMAAVKGVDAVILFGEQTPVEVIQTLLPDVLVKGADYAEDQIVGADIVKAHGGRIVRVGLVEGQSTTKVIEKSRKP